MTAVAAEVTELQLADGASATSLRWTLLSRATGGVRAFAVALVLGAGWLGNTYGATNALPNMVFELLAGSLVASLLVPPVARALGAGLSVRRLEGGLVAVVALAGALGSFLLWLAAPWMAQLLTLGAPQEVSAQQRRAAEQLLVMFAPQVLGYCLAATGAALQQAHGRFAVAAGAPAVENLGVLVVLAIVVFHGDARASLSETGSGQLLLLGAGTTAAVWGHAAVQLCGARAAGCRMWPTRSWEPEVRTVARRALPAVGYASLNAVRLLGPLILANRVAGGVVAMQLAFALYYLPLALGARPIAGAVLPGISRLEGVGDRVAAVSLLGEARDRIVVLCLPCSALLLVTAPLLGAVLLPGSSGSLAACVAVLALGVISEGTFALATATCFARDEAAPPFKAMGIRVSVGSLFLLAAFFSQPGPAVLLLAVGGLSAGNVTASWWLMRQIGCPPLHLPSEVLRAATASAVVGAGGSVVTMWLTFGRFVNGVGLVASLLCAALTYAWLCREQPGLKALAIRRAVLS